MHHHLLKRCFAEMIGTFAIIFVGGGALMSLDPRSILTPLQLAFTFTFMVAAMVYAIGPLSGGHVNPAVTLGAALAKKLPAKEVVPYWIAQVIGGYIASLILVYLVIPANIGNAAELQNVIPRGIAFNTAMIVEAICTFLLVTVVLSVTTKKTMAGASGIAIGMVIFGCATAFGGLTDISLNPALAMGPALLDIQHLGHVIPFVIGPMVGGLIAGLLFSFMNHD